MAVDTKKLEQFLGQFVTDLGATVHAGMVVIGDRLGLYKALAAGPLTAPELAALTRTDERYVREWLASQAAGRGRMRPANKLGHLHSLSPAHHRGVPLGRRDGLGRARGSGVSRMRKVFSSGLRRESGQLQDSGARWRP